MATKKKITLVSKTKSQRRMHLKKMKMKMMNYLNQSGFAVPIRKAIIPMTLWIKWYVHEISEITARCLFLIIWLLGSCELFGRIVFCVIQCWILPSILVFNNRKNLINLFSVFISFFNVFLFGLLVHGRGALSPFALFEQNYLNCPIFP